MTVSRTSLAACCTPAWSHWRNSLTAACRPSARDHPEQTLVIDRGKVARRCPRRPRTRTRAGTPFGSAPWPAQPSDAAETQTSTEGNPPSKWAPTPIAQPAGTPDREQQGYPVASRHLADLGLHRTYKRRDRSTARHAARYPPPRPASHHRHRPLLCSSAHASTPPAGRHPARSGHTERESAYPATLRPPIAALKFSRTPASGDQCHFTDRVDGREPAGGIGSDCSDHALTLTSPTTMIKARVLRSRRLYLCGDHHYYDPLGLPLSSARFRHRLIRTVFADEAAQTGLPCSATRPCTRATSRTPQGPAAPDPEPGLADMAFTVT